MLRSEPAEIANSVKRIGQYVLEATIRPLDPSSRSVDAALAAALGEMPNLHTLTIICDPLDTRKHYPVLGALRHLRALEHISLTESPRSPWPIGWPIRLGHHDPTTQLEEEEEEEEEAMENSGSGSEGAPDTDTDTKAQTGAQTGTARLSRATKNFHSFRKQCLTALLQHHAPRLVSLRLHGSVPLDEHNYRLLRDRACNLYTLHLIGGLESCEPGLVAAIAEETRWACADKLCHLIIRGTGPSTKSEARLMCQFRLGVFGDAADEPFTFSSVYPSHGACRA